MCHLVCCSIGHLRTKPAWAYVHKISKPNIADPDCDLCGVDKADAGSAGEVFAEDEGAADAGDVSKEGELEAADTIDHWFMAEVVLVEDRSSNNRTVVALCDLEDVQILKGLRIKVWVLNGQNVVNL